MRILYVHTSLLGLAAVTVAACGGAVDGRTTDDRVPLASSGTVRVEDTIGTPTPSLTVSRPPPPPPYTCTRDYCECETNEDCGYCIDDGCCVGYPWCDGETCWFSYLGGCGW